MIIGHGLLAKAFSKYYLADATATIFAQGVSNSLEVSESAFDRERQILDGAIQSAPGRLIYFSSCAAGNTEEPTSPYIRHKIAMEKMALSRCGSTVFRLPQVVGRTGNPTNLANHVYRHVSTGTQFSVWAHAERNLVDVEDVATIVSTLINSGVGEGETIPIAALESTRMPDLVSLFENILERKAVYTLVDAGRPFQVEAGIALDTAAKLQLGLDNGSDYTRRVLKKYYGTH